MGLAEKKPLNPQKLEHGDILILIGTTKDELGGSEYYEYIHGFIGGKCPKVDFGESKQNMESVLHIIENNWAKNVHDCSKGGLAIAVSELAMTSGMGCMVSIDKVPSSIPDDKILFSESHSRYLVVPSNLDDLVDYLKKKKVNFGIIGKFEGKNITFLKNKKAIAKLSVDKAHDKWFNSLKDLVLHG
ncbi:MAG: phosphoribosylformylglycinamidine synthase [Candidatus Nitrosotenuis sp.]|nr:phosphoribosylformylglycinamidine synthase [Candidatus Nitrosotenuis sp.]